MGWILGKLRNLIIFGGRRRLRLNRGLKCKKIQEYLKSKIKKVESKVIWDSLKL